MKPTIRVLEVEPTDDGEQVHLTGASYLGSAPIDACFRVVDLETCLRGDGNGGLLVSVLCRIGADDREDVIDLRVDHAGHVVGVVGGGFDAVTSIELVPPVSADGNGDTKEG